MDRDDLDRAYDFHPVNSTRAPLHDAFNKAVKDLAILFETEIVSDEGRFSDEELMFHERLREARMWGNAHIACNE